MAGAFRDRERLAGWQGLDHDVVVLLDAAAGADQQEDTGGPGRFAAGLGQVDGEGGDVVVDDHVSVYLPLIFLNYLT
jgi:hypothetical protein